MYEDEESWWERDVDSIMRTDRVELSRKMKLSKSDEESWLKSCWFASKWYSSTEEIDVSLVWYYYVNLSHRIFRVKKNDKQRFFEIRD